MRAATRVGVLYGRADVLAAMPPWQGGGDMIEPVTLEGSSWAAPPARFEAGTPPIAAVLGLATALDYLEAVGLDRIAAWEEELLRLATERVGEIRGVRLVGTAPEKVAVLSFILDGVHPHDVGTILDDEGVAVRAGPGGGGPGAARRRWRSASATLTALWCSRNRPAEELATFTSFTLLTQLRQVS